VIECVPTASELIVSVATPLLIVPVPRDVAPSWKVTVPVAPVVTAAESVTLAPKAEGLREEVRVTVGVAMLTTWDTAVEVAPSKLVFPPYCAVIECVPTPSELVARVATPLLIVPVPRDVVPSWKVTVPVAPDGRVAVKVTLAPNVDGFGEERRVTVGVAKLTTWDSAVETEVL
jgi:hypothetical protein